MKDMNDATQIWKWYDKGVDHHNKMRLYSETERLYSMVEGDQWEFIEKGDADYLSSHDFITGIVEYKVAMVAMNAVTINYSPMNTGDNQAVYQQACEKLNAYASSKWELTKMDIADWEAVNAACVTGDSYLYFYDKDLNHQMIDRTNIYFADEQEQDIQKQKRVIIYERRFVEDVKEDARNNGIDEQEIESIVSDEDTDTLPTIAKQEVENDKKCSCLLCIEKKPLPPPNAQPEGIFISRSTKTVVYQPAEQVVGKDEDGNPVGIGTTLIPIAKMMWYPKRGSSRGVGEVKRLIANQINSNKLLYRREESIKISAFPKPVVNTDMITNPEDGKKVGAMMKMKGMATRVSEAFGYVAPQTATSEPKELQEEYIIKSKDLANAGDAATGNINPEQASGAAIIAVRDQQAITSNKPKAYHKQFIEDIAAIWLDTWVAYNPNGMTVEIEQDMEDGTKALAEQVIPAEVLQTLKANSRIDISPTNPYSKFAREQAIENALANGHITFDEYVEALDEDGSAPKGKFEDILEKRKALAEEQAIAEQQAMQEQQLLAQQQAEEAMMQESAMQEEQTTQAQIEQAISIIEQQKQLLEQYEQAEPQTDPEIKQKLDMIIQGLGG